MEGSKIQVTGKKDFRKELKEYLAAQERAKELLEQLINFILEEEEKERREGMVVDNGQPVTFQEMLDKKAEENGR